MFIAVSFPFADCRPFLTPERRLQKPAWPLVGENDEFGHRKYVRACGAATRRLQGGVDPWPAEDYFVEAKNALKFQPPLPNITSYGKNASGIQQCLFRRLFADGKVLVRFDVGIRLKLLAGGAPPSLEEVLDKVLGSPVVVPKSSSMRDDVLIGCSEALAQHLLWATSADRVWLDSAESRSCISSGDPLIIVELPYYQRLNLSTFAKFIDLSGGYGVQLWSYRHRYNGVWCHHWLIAPQVNCDLAIVRRLRIHLVRLHQFREALKRVMTNISNNRITFETRSDLSDRVQEFLDKAIAELGKKRRSGFPQADLLNVAYEADASVSEGQLATLLHCIDDIRPTLKKKVIEKIPEIFNRWPVKTETIYGSKIVIKDSIVDRSAFGLENCQVAINTVQGSSLSEERKNVIAKLGNAIDALAADALAADQPQKATLLAQMVADYEYLAEQMVHDKPRKRTITNTLTELLDAAKKFAEAGTPIIELINNISRFFA